MLTDKQRAALIHALNDVGTGQTTGFDDGVRAALIALGVAEDEVSAVFAEALAAEQAAWLQPAPIRQIG